MRKTIFLILLFPSFLIAQNFDSAWLSKNYTKKEIMIPMRDGVRLFTSFYIPNDQSEQHPILLTRTPYSCAPYGENRLRNFQRGHWKEYLKENYIIVTQDVRGRWMSEGVFEDVKPYNNNQKTSPGVDEATDTYDAIDWMVKNIPNNNGKVGVFGISYPGFYSTMAALSNHPALKAVSPQAPVTDWFIGDDFHHNGAFMLMDAFSFYSGFGKPRPKPTTVGPTGFIFPTNDNYSFYLKTGPLPEFAKLMGDSILFWKDLYNHPTYDAWWKARNTRNFVQNISPQLATLVVGGLFDAEDCFGAWNLYKAIEKKATNNNKIVMGPWYHGQWASGDGTKLGNVQFGSNTAAWYATNIEVPFFNYYLKGKGSLNNLPEASIFFSGENDWRTFQEWPVATAITKKFFLLADGKLDTISSKKETYSEYISDPAKPVPYTEDIHLHRTREYMTDDQRFAARRTDVLTYQSALLETDLTLAGPIIANIVTAISTTDADFVVKIIDVFPDDFAYPSNSNYPMTGYQMLVRGEIMRGKFRKSFEQPIPFKPNTKELVRFQLPDIAHTFKKGHRLMVQVQSSWFPLADRNPQQFLDIFKAKASDFIKSTVKIYEPASYIEAPIISNSAAHLTSH